MSWQYNINVTDLMDDPRVADGIWRPNSTAAIETHREWADYLRSWEIRFREHPIWLHRTRRAPSQQHAGYITLAEIIDEMQSARYGDIDHLNACIQALYDWGDHLRRLWIETSKPRVDQ